jgi:hypothetical protein
VKADVSSQLIGPLHRDRFRLNQGDLIPRGVKPTEKRGHLHQFARSKSGGRKKDFFRKKITRVLVNLNLLTNFFD